MHLYYSIWECLTLPSTFAMILTLFLMGLFLDSLFFVVYYIIKGDKQEIRKFLFRTVILLLPLTVGLIVLLYYFPEYLEHVLEKNILGFFFEGIRVFHDALLLFSSVSLLYAIYLKIKKLPGAIWHIKKFTVYYIFSLFLLLIVYMIHPYSYILGYMLFLLVPFVLFHILYFIFRKYKKGAEKYLGKLKKKLDIKLLLLLGVMLVILLVIVIYTTYDSTEDLSEAEPNKEKVEKTEEIDEIQEDQEREDFNESLEKEVEEVPDLYDNYLFNLVRKEVLQEKTVSYERTTLDKSSNGVLAILYSGFEYDEEEYYERILFIDEESEEVFTLSDNLYEFVNSSDCSNEYFSCTKGIEDFLLLHDTLYFLHGPYFSWKLQKLHVLGGEVATVDLKYRSGESVIAYHVLDDTIYYLYGEQCREYMGSCNSSLYSYSIKTNETNLLATNLPYRDINVFEKNGKNILMFYRDGDAGFIWLSYGTYNVLTKELSQVKDVNFSYDWDKSDEENDKEYEVAFKDFLALFKDEKYVPYLIIQDGEIILPEEKMDTGDYNTISIRVY
jgi:hypothetical protein